MQAVTPSTNEVNIIMSSLLRPQYLPSTLTRHNQVEAIGYNNLVKVFTPDVVQYVTDFQKTPVVLASEGEKSKMKSAS